MSSDLLWNEDHEIIDITWRNAKTGHLQSIPIISDANSWNLDLYNVIACLRIVGNGKEIVSHGKCTDEHFMNHMYYNTNTNSSKSNTFGGLLNSAMRSLGDGWLGSGVASKLTATSFRKGAIDEILLHPELQHKHVVGISGHDCSNICTIFEYTTCERALSLLAARGLAGWKHVYSPVGKTARLDLLYATFTGEEIDHFNIFIVDALTVRKESIYNKGKDLWPFTKCLMATILKDLREMIQSNAGSVVVRQLLESATRYYKEHGLLQQLCLWGDIIRDDWIQRNTEVEEQAQLERVNKVLAAEVNVLKVLLYHNTS